MSERDGPASERLSAAKLWLTATAGGDATYLSAALYAMPTVLTSSVDAIAADDSWRLYANPAWVSAVDVPLLGAHLAHLIWHLLRDHAGRAASMGVGQRESSAWGRAADLTIAQTLEAAGHPLAGLVDPRDVRVARDLAVEQYYAQITRLQPVIEQEPLCACGSGADGIPRSYQARGDAADGLNENHGQELRRQVAIAFTQHMNTRGTEPGEWSRWVEQILEPKVPWQQVLSASVRRAVAFTHGNTHSTYRKLSRRQAATSVILPGTQRALPTVAVVVDTSASMDDGLLAQALGEVDGVLRALGDAIRGINVYSCDAAAHTTREVTHARDLHLIGGGGTDLRVGIDAALAARPRPEILVVLTDGYTPWPPAPPRACIVVAVLLTRGAVPSCPAWVTKVDCQAA